MKVLFYRSHVCQDGIASWMMTLASQLRRLGVECAFWFPKVFYKPAADFERLGPVYTAPPHEAAEILHAGRYDVVHVENHDHTAELLSLVRPAPRIVVTSHGDLSDAWNCRNCFAYTGVSPDMAALNQPLTDLDVEIVANGVDCERFTPPARVAGGTPVVAWVGRSADLRKDFPRFTRVAARLATKGVRLWVADAHRATTTDLASQDCCQVTFERWERIPVERMPQFYQEVAAAGGTLLMTSRHEGWGIVATEAAASGVPTIGPDVAGLRRAIIPEVTGMLYPAEAADEDVADRVGSFLETRHRGAAATEACVAAARQAFSAEAMARHYLAIYSRPQQRMCDRPVASRDTTEPGLDSLIGRLRTQRWHRAAFLSEAARALALAGQPSLAWRALRRSVAVAPRSAVRPARTFHLLTTGAIILGRQLRPVGKAV